MEEVCIGCSLIFAASKYASSIELVVLWDKEYWTETIIVAFHEAGRVGLLNGKD